MTLKENMQELLSYVGKPLIKKDKLLDTLASCTIMEHTEDAISLVMSYGYNRKEAINILDGKNADGSKFIDFPF